MCLRYDAFHYSKDPVSNLSKITHRIQMCFVGQGYENCPFSDTLVTHCIPTLITKELQL